MKKIKLILAVITISLASCSDYLDVVPDNVATIEYAFRSRNEAEKYAMKVSLTLVFRREIKIRQSNIKSSNIYLNMTNL